MCRIQRKGRAQNAWKPEDEENKAVSRLNPLIARPNYFEKAKKNHQFFLKKYFFKDNFSTRTNDLGINYC